MVLDICTYGSLSLSITVAVKSNPNGSQKTIEVEGTLPVKLKTHSNNGFQHKFLDEQKSVNSTGQHKTINLSATRPMALFHWTIANQ